MIEAPHRAPFGLPFVVGPLAEGRWTWRAFDTTGQTCGQGEAPSRAQAAMFVIHALTATQSPPPTRPERYVQ